MGMCVLGVKWVWWGNLSYIEFEASLSCITLSENQNNEKNGMEVVAK